MKREFGQNVAPVNTAPNQNAYSAQIRTLPIEEQMEIALQLQEKELGVDGAHQASATSNPYSAKGPEWNGIAFPPSDGNGNFVPVVAGGECGNKFDSAAWLENFGRV